MRALRTLVSIFSVIFVIATVLLWFRSIKMNEKPVITCSVEGNIKVLCSATDEDLLKFVKATDTRDGDITKEIIVERGNYFISKGITSINYAVCDSDNNVTKLQKNVEFTDYQSPKFVLNGDLIYYINSKDDFSDVVGAQDVYDGDISDRVKIISSSYNKSIPGKYDVDCKVTNSFGDTSEIVFSIIVSDGDPQARKINLKDYIIYTKVGEQPDFSANIADFNGYAENQVAVDANEFNADAPGTYSIYYRVSGQIRARVLAVVEE